MIRASAPAKAILFGEHAVVYGHPAIAFPIHGLCCEVTGAKSSDERTHIIAPETGESLYVDEDFEHPLIFAWKLAQEALEQELPATHFQICSTIPIAAGFGSGAALSAALIRACQLVAGIELPLKQLNQLVYVVEKHYHGNPSGIDNHVVVFQRPLYFQRGNAPEFINLKAGMPIIGLRCGGGAPTRTVVEDVRLRRLAYPDQINPMLESIAVITKAAKEALLAGDMAYVGELMYENHSLLKKLGVSSSTQDRVVEFACANGALGAKMSGAGWGGQVLVLTAPGSLADFSKKLCAAGYPPVFSEVIV